MSMSGASATLGTALSATSSGWTMRSTGAQAASATPMRTPTTTEIAKPSTVASVVLQLSLNSTPGSRTKASATSGGDGRMKLWTDSTAVVSHHRPIAMIRPRTGQATAEMRRLRGDEAGAAVGGVAGAVATSVM